MLPNKLIKYEESIIPKAEKLILEIRKTEGISILKLYQNTTKILKDIDEYLEALCLLYSINYIKYENGGIKIC